MYSKEAIEAYGEMLKLAGSSVTPEFEKWALTVPGNLGMRPAVSAGRAALGGTLEATRSAIPKGPGFFRRALDKFKRPAASPAAPPALNPFEYPNISGKDLVEEMMAGASTAKPAGAGAGHMLAGGLATAGLGVGAYGLGKHKGQENAKSQRNLAFGAGAAAGLVAPSLLRNVADTAQTVSLSPSSLIPRRY
jgi:hypothetical protein